MTPNTYDGQSPPHSMQPIGMISVLDRNRLGDHVTGALSFVLPMRVALLDRNGRILAVNEAWKRHSNDPAMSSGIARGDVGMDFVSVCHSTLETADETFAPIEASIRAVLGGQQSEYAVEYFVDPRIGRRWFLLQLHALPSNVSGAVVAHLDITESKLTEEWWEHSKSHERVAGAGLMKGGRADDAALADTPSRAQSPLMFRLHALEALTDTTLSQLPLEQLIGELLERALSVLRVDNAAILLLEQDGKTLSLRAARGPEMELIGPATMSVGTGFAGCIAASGKPLTLDDVSTSQIVTVQLRDKVRSLAGVPLVVEDRLVGVMQVGTTTARHFTDEDVNLLLLVADRIAPALERARLRTAEQEAHARAEAAMARATSSESRDRRRAEELQTIVETIADGVAVVDQAGRIAQTNRAFRELLALAVMPEHEDMQATDWAQRLQVRNVAGAPVLPEQLAIFRALRGEVVKGPGTDILVRRADGSEVEVTTSAAPIRDPDENIVGAVVVARDISWRKRLERERELAIANELALKETTQRLDEFLATAAHDLRAPLAVATTAIDLAASRMERVAFAMQGNSNDLERRLEPIHSCLEEASQSVDRLSRMVTMLLDTTQLRAGTLELHRSTCDLLHVVREQVEALQKANLHREIHAGAPVDRPVFITADVDRISQVVTNFITNAIKYSSEEEPIWVDVAIEEAQVRVSVRDHGPGLPPSELERVWQRFYRVPGIRVQGRQSSGLGLGLHICKTIVERHGGHVGVESAEGSGSTFWFTLPTASTQM